MRTQYYAAMSLDGYLATVDDSLDWLFPLADPQTTSYPEFIRNVGALAMGSATYDWLLRNLATIPDGTPSSWPYMQPTWVFSRRTLPRAPGADIRFVPLGVHLSSRARRPSTPRNPSRWRTPREPTSPSRPPEEAALARWRHQPWVQGRIGTWY
jgi:hypothetical protein